MVVITYILLAIIIFLCIILAVLTLFLRENKFEAKPYSTKVSIVVAARDEEDNILECLEAINNLSYDQALLDVYIGNDHSEDKTKDIIKAFIIDKPHFHLVDIKEQVGEAKGKANVLAQLISRVNGEIILVTDADIEVPVNWVEGMLAHFEEGVGVVSGFTVAKGKSFFARMQKVDWAYAMGMVKVVSDMDIALVGVGNNMGFTKAAYVSTGGYEKLPFSVVEDYQLFNEIVKQGYGYANLMNGAVTAASKPHTSLLELLKQRKRWMFGAFQLKWQILSILILQAMYYPAVIMLAFFDPQKALNLFVLKTFMQAVFMKYVFKIIKKRAYLFEFVAFEFYQTVVSFLSLVYYLWPGGIKWKGRTY